MKIYAGSCHCGAIGFDYATDIAPSEWSVRACQCSFCRAHAALSASDPQGHARFFATEPELLERYTFALRTADFLLCRRCGVYVGAVIHRDVEAFSIVNTRALKESPRNLPGPAAMVYDTEDAAARRERRYDRWTPTSDEA